MIDAYELRPNAEVTGADKWISPQVDLARQLYKPAAFSVPYFRPWPVSVESNPDGAVRYMISNPFFKDGIAPPYVVKHFDGKNLTTIKESK
jgi:hypothetical protein